VVSQVFWLLPAAANMVRPTSLGQRSETDRLELETLRREKMDAAAQRQREAERLAKAEQEKKLAEERTRLEMEAKKKAAVPQARRDAEAK
jgi:hypothetical protein